MNTVWSAQALARRKRRFIARVPLRWSHSLIRWTTSGARLAAPDGALDLARRKGYGGIARPGIDHQDDIQPRLRQIVDDGVAARRQGGDELIAAAPRTGKDQLTKGHLHRLSPHERAGRAVPSTAFAQGGSVIRFKPVPAPLEKLSAFHGRGAAPIVSAAQFRHQGGHGRGDHGRKRMSKPFIPYARQTIDEDDIAAVAEALRGDWLTQGPRVAAFEDAVAGPRRRPPRHRRGDGNGGPALRVSRRRGRTGGRGHHRAHHLRRQRQLRPLPGGVGPFRRCPARHLLP